MESYSTLLPRTCSTVRLQETTRIGGHCRAFTKQFISITALLSSRTFDHCYSPCVLKSNLSRLHTTVSFIPNIITSSSPLFFVSFREGFPTSGRPLQRSAQTRSTSMECDCSGARSSMFKQKIACYSTDYADEPLKFLPALIGLSLPNSHA